ncbi:NADH-quinone oxidoreductase subunit N [Sediminibacterium soli]|uniref:NADH-quinone oxidoreductase subunit N n=1 Tax=Sediminibacterium soli TaxID=2698829 RepID=UPI0013794FE5|nr:NADH-quinone oxidoreductase subunit N [Sediminibacterium soli]NCI47199.1 NADH-quinone oxidoreductase subunit N [Sediminibacterium soli]
MLTDTFLLFRQEIMLALLLFFLVLYKLGRARPAAHLLPIMNWLLLLNLVVGLLFYDWQGVLFNGMYRTGELIVLEKNILNLAVWLISMQAYGWLRQHRHAAEVYLLLLTSLLGMFLMLSSGHMLILYVGLEMATIPLAAAVNFALSSKRSSEAAMKMIVSSAFASALLLLGISFLYGITGSLWLAEIPGMLHATPVVLFTFLLVFSGFAFKVSAVPFHLWTADVYEGAPVAVTAYLSVVSKAAMVFVLVTLLYSVFAPLEKTSHAVLVVLSLLTIITGNLFALRQQNIKRFLAFSSIAQIGFILVGISGYSQTANASVIFFLLVYVFSNLAAFGVVGWISTQTGKETIADYANLYRHNKTLSWILAIAVFSLAGVPPTAGFFGKFFLLTAGASKGDYLFISVAALNMVVSFYYYLRIIKAIFMEPGETGIAALSLPFWPQLSLWICTGGMLASGLLGVIYQYIYSISPSH